jgi:hypothetical protein
VSAVAFFRLQCDGECGRWLSDVTGNGVPKVTTVRSRALVFPDAEEALALGAEVGWSECRCNGGKAKDPADSPPHAGDCEVACGVVICGSCRTLAWKRKRSETETG